MLNILADVCAKSILHREKLGTICIMSWLPTYDVSQACARHISECLENGPRHRPTPEIESALNGWLADPEENHSVSRGAPYVGENESIIVVVILVSKVGLLKK